MKFNIKITAGIILLAVVAFSISYVAFASNDITILIDGEELKTSQKAIFVEDMAFVPMDEVFERLGASVSWNSEKNKATCLYKGTSVTINLKNPVIADGTVMVPLRTVSDYLDCSVIWRGKDSIASISSKRTLMKIHFLDCGQADSIFAELTDGKCMLIDAGESSFGKPLEDFIKGKGYSHIDYVVATHPHSDHIGGLGHIINNFTIGSFYTSDIINDTRSFDNLMDALEKKGCEINLVSQGDEIPVSSCEVRVLSPRKRQYLRMNNYSTVLKIIYNKVSAVLCGDAEAEAERGILDNEKDLKTDVLKVGHHGSFTSTTSSFLKALQPRDAVISVGKDNKYGYPSKLIVNRLKNRGIKIHRTDEDGNITMVTDGYIYIIVGDK